MGRFKRYSGTNSTGFRDKLDGGGKEEEILAYTTGCRVVPDIETGTNKTGQIFGKKKQDRKKLLLSLTLDMLSIR